MTSRWLDFHLSGLDSNSWLLWANRHDDRRIVMRKAASAVPREIPGAEPTSFGLAGMQVGRLFRKYRGVRQCGGCCSLATGSLNGSPRLCGYPQLLQNLHMPLPGRTLCGVGIPAGRTQPALPAALRATALRPSCLKWHLFPNGTGTLIVFSSPERIFKGLGGAMRTIHHSLLPSTESAGRGTVIR